ncbi:MAG TPA: hypothetical protein VFQ15_03555 [Jiangellaceae bacterium]|nr:hypothetical protein [Jiangellaceae bacterium]
MTETGTNRGRYLALNAGLSGLDLRMLVILGTQTGVSDPDLNTVADLDAVTGVSIHSERIALTGETITEDDTNNRAAADANNVSFAAAPSTTAQGVAIYDEGNGTDAGRQLIGIYTTGFPVPMDGGLTVQIADYLRMT